MKSYIDIIVEKFTGFISFDDMRYILLAKKMLSPSDGYHKVYSRLMISGEIYFYDLQNNICFNYYPGRGYMLQK